MSMPKFPEYPDIDICQSLSHVIESIALEELALAHLINAEAEKVQKVADPDNDADTCEMLHVNKSVSKTLVNVVKLQMLLQFKLEEVLENLPENCEEESFGSGGRRKKKYCND